MRSQIIIIALLIAQFAIAQQEAPPGNTSAAEATPPVVMAPFEVQDIGFSLGFSISRITGKISSVKFTRVADWSAAGKAGLRADDNLIAIDGVAVVGKKYSDFAALMNRSVPSGQSTQYSFTVTRGTRKNRATQIITFSVKLKELKKEANQTSEPTAPSSRGSP